MKTPWHAPSWGSEAGEFKRVSKETGIHVSKLKSAFGKAKVGPVKPKHFRSLDNTDANSGEHKTVSSVHRMGKKYGGKDTHGIHSALSAGESLPAPIILHRPGKSPSLVAGNTRLTMATTMGKKAHALHVHVDEASLHAPESFRRLLASLDSRSISDLVQMYGGADRVMHVMRGLSFKHQQTIPGNLHQLARSSEAEWAKQGYPGKRKPPRHPPLEYAYGDNVRTTDGQIKGKVIGLRRFNKDENAYMFRISHHDEPAIITVHPHTLLQRDGVAVKRRNYNESERPMNRREAFDELVREGLSPDEAIEFMSETDEGWGDLAIAGAMAAPYVWRGVKAGVGAVKGWTAGRAATTAAKAAPVVAAAAPGVISKVAGAVKGAASTVAGGVKSAVGSVATKLAPAKATQIGLNRDIDAFKTAGKASKTFMGPPAAGQLSKPAAQARMVGSTAGSQAARAQVGGAILKTSGKVAGVGAGLGGAALLLKGDGPSSSSSSASGSPSPNSTPVPPGQFDRTKAKPAPGATPGGQTDYGVGGGVLKPGWTSDGPAAGVSAPVGGGGKKTGFQQAFADARKAGKSDFQFNAGGKLQTFNTKLSGEGGAAHQRATSAAGATTPAPPSTPDNTTFEFGKNSGATGGVAGRAFKGGQEVPTAAQKDSQAGLGWSLRR